MLASPLYPTPSFSPRKSVDSETQYRPAKDMEAFNSLLPPAIEFIEGSSSGTLVLGEGKYEPINGSPKAKAEPLPSPSAKQRRNSTITASSNKTSLYTGTIDTSWPHKLPVGCGLNNTGNTCFLNSALQCLLYTPPLVRVLSAHEPCKLKHTFCMACSLKQTMQECRKQARSFTPYSITTKLATIGKHFRRGRQEDSHEFLRYAIDALQKSCLAGYPPKIDPKLAETTWVHKIFGGHLRSRVTCQECGFDSDTLDSILDLSIDIYGVNSVRDALRKFVAVDHLKGANKYKCEKCKKPVTAEKQFTIHDAPAVLTIHLKRFSPMGRKIGHIVKYDDKLTLQPYMSETKYGPTYSLFGVISHAGGGPNSGHYYAHIKDGADTWYEMNDESVTRHVGTPLSMKNAYVLFYVRDKGQALESAITIPAQRPLQKSGIVGGMKKRKASETEDGAEDTGVAASPPKPRFIGPLLPPSSPSKSPVNESKKKQKLDPQAKSLQQKIQAATGAASALQSLSQYDETDEESEPAGSKEDAEKAREKLPIPPSTPAPVSPVNFYGGGGSSDKKRKSMDGNGRQFSSLANRSPGGDGGWPGKKQKKSFGAGNPYSRVKGGSNLGRSGQTYGKKNRHRS